MTFNLCRCCVGNSLQGINVNFKTRRIWDVFHTKVPKENTYLRHLELEGVQLFRTVVLPQKDSWVPGLARMLNGGQWVTPFLIPDSHLNPNPAQKTFNRDMNPHPESHITDMSQQSLGTAGFQKFHYCIE